MNKSYHRENARREHTYPVIPFFIALLFTFFQTATICFSLPISPGYIHIDISQQKEGPIISFDNLQTRDITNSFKDIDNLFKQSLYEKIIALAHTVIKRNPQSGLAYEVLGTALFMQKSDKEAIAALKKATTIEPSQSGSFTKLGTIYLKNEDIENAQTFLQKAIFHNNKDRIAHQYLGLLYEYKRDNDAAIEHFAQGLIGTDPLYLGVAVNLGRLLNQKNLFQKTIEILEPRLPLSVTDSYSHLILGTAYYQLQRYDKAQQRFERVVELAPHMLEAHLGISMSLRKNGMLKEALKNTKRILEKKTEWGPAIMEYGETLLLLGNVSEAMKYFDIGIAQGSSDVAVKKRLAKHYIKEKKFVKVEKILHKLISNKNADPEVFIQLSEMQQAQGKLDSGLTTLKKGTETYPQSGYLHFRLGSYLASLKKYDGALPELNKAIKLSPNNPLILQTACFAQVKAGKNLEALETARKLAALLPQDSKALILLATRLQAVDQMPEAVEVYHNILNLEPKHTLALNNLADLLADMGKLDKAEELAKQLNSLTNNANGFFLDTLGWIFYQKKQYAKATKTLSAASTAAPQAAVITYHLGMSQAAEGKKDLARQTLRLAINSGSNQEWIDDAKKELKKL